MRIDDAIDRLIAAHRDRVADGVPGLRPPADPAAVTAAVARIAAEVAPLTLPAELTRLWERVDLTSLTELAPYPQPTSLTTALEIWGQDRDEPGMHPRLLFPFGYESHGWLLVELEDGNGSGGPLFDVAVGSEAFVLVHPSVSAYLELRAEFLERGRYAVEAEDGSLWVHVDPADEWRAACAAQVAAAAPVGLFGDVTRIQDDAGSWPEHWRAADGISPETTGLRGADTTVRDLLAGPAGAGGTIRGRVVGVFMTGDGRQATVDDGTGTVDVWCPAVTRHFGPVLRGEFEFDVVVRPRTVVATAVRAVPGRSRRSAG